MTFLVITKTKNLIPPFFPGKGAAGGGISVIRKNKTKFLCDPIGKTKADSFFNMKTIIQPYEKETRISQI